MNSEIVFVKLRVSIPDASDIFTNHVTRDRIAR